MTTTTRTGNRLAGAEEFDGDRYLHQHSLVTEDTMRGQQPARAWEYTQALDALEQAGWDFHDTRQLLMADIGGAGSNFWKTLTHYTKKPIYRIDPNHEWENPEVACLLFRQTVGQFLQARAAEGMPQFDAVFALSVIEHIPDPLLDPFFADLDQLVAPGGLVVLTTDAAPAGPDLYHFYWMRERIFTPLALGNLVVSLFRKYRWRPLGVPDFSWHGPTVYNYTFASLVLQKERP